MKYTPLTTYQKRKLRKQVGKCEICSETTIPLVVDHCKQPHGCDDVLGILCFFCNLLKDWGWSSDSARDQIATIAKCYPSTNYAGIAITQIEIPDSYNPTHEMIMSYTMEHSCWRKHSKARFAKAEESLRKKYGS